MCFHFLQLQADGNKQSNNDFYENSSEEEIEPLNRIDEENDGKRFEKESESIKQEMDTLKEVSKT